MGTNDEREMEKGKELLREILRATNEERIHWLPTAKLDEYTGSFNGRWSIVVGGDAEEDFYVRITDDQGQVVLRLTSGEVQRAARGLYEQVDVEVRNPVRELFEAVSHKAFHSDKRIDEFLQDLKRA